MPIDVSCPHCGKGYRLAESQVGKKVQCRKCDAGFVVRDPDDEPEEERPRQRDRDRDDDRVSDRRRRDRDDEDERPRRRSRDDDDDRPRRRKSGGLSPIFWVLVIGGPILLVVGVVVVILFATGGGGLGTRITQANCDRIKIGMTEAEVNAIIGPGVDYDVALQRRSGRMGPDEAKIVKMMTGLMEWSKAMGIIVKIHDGFNDDYISVAYHNGRVGNAEFGNWRVPKARRFR